MPAMRNLFGGRRDGENPGPDYSHVDSRETAEQLVSRGELARLHLVPPEFGGTDDARNLVYVPPFVVELKQQTDANAVAPLVREGRVRCYVATPQYEGPASSPRRSRSGPRTGRVRDLAADLGTGARGRLSRIRSALARRLYHVAGRIAPLN
jgi:hypothetical protein